jgi:hypothetical protein
LLRGAFAGTGALGQNMAQYHHTRNLSFIARSAKRDGGFCVRGAYWKRPNELRDKKDANSTQERWGYEGGGRFGTLDEAELHIEPFQLCVENMRKDECDGGDGGGGGGASHTKQYAAEEAERRAERGGQEAEAARQPAGERTRPALAEVRAGAAEGVAQGEAVGLPAGQGGGLGGVA